MLKKNNLTTKITALVLCFIPVTAWSYIDKYDPYWDNKGNGKDFVWFVILGGIVLLINWIINLFKDKNGGKNDRTI